MKRCIILAFFHLISTIIYAQDLEPRSYANLPKGLNAVNVLYSLAHGNVIADPSLPIKGFTITTHGFGAAYVHTFSLAKKLARVQVVVPFVHMSGNLKLNGDDTAGIRTGFGDARLRFGINLIGSPALDKKDFITYEQKPLLE